MSSLDQGEVAITIAGKDLVLKPSLRTAMAVSRQYGGFIPASQKLMSFDIDTMVYVVRLGTGMSDAEAKGLDKRIYDSGLGNLLKPLVDYLNILGNGGKPLPVDGEETQADVGN